MYKCYLISRAYMAVDEALREMYELLDVVNSVGVYVNGSGVFMVGETAHHSVRYEYHIKNGKLVEFTYD